jgi:hypothetical protein
MLCSYYYTYAVSTKAREEHRRKKLAKDVTIVDWIFHFINYSLQASVWCLYMTGPIVGHVGRISEVQRRSAPGIKAHVWEIGKIINQKWTYFQYMFFHFWTAHGWPSSWLIHIIVPTTSMCGVVWNYVILNAHSINLGQNRKDLLMTYVSQLSFKTFCPGFYLSEGCLI